MEPVAKDVVDVEVGDEQGLVETLRPGEQLARRVEDHAAPVEDELVLAADEVYVADEDALVGGAGGEEFLAVVGLAGVERRGVDVHDHLGAGLGLQDGRADGVPDVLADVHADARAAVPPVDGVDWRRVAGPEVALLVEDAVIGQVHLAVDAGHLAVAGHGGGVVDVLAGLDEADDRGDPARRLDDAVEGGEVAPDELLLEQQVFGRIAGRRQLGEGDKIGAGRLRPLDALDGLRGVAVEVADGGIDLGERHPKGVHPRPLTTGSKTLASRSRV